MSYVTNRDPGIRMPIQRVESTIYRAISRGIGIESSYTLDA